MSPDAPGPSPARIARNVPLVLALNASFMFLLVMPVVVPYLRSHGLDLGDVYALQAVFAVATLVLELPTGYVSDLIGRRRALLVAAVAKGVAFSWLAFADSFADFVVFELLAAVSIAFFSGSDLAILYASLEQMPEPKEDSTRAIGRNVFVGQLGETAAALLAGLLVTISLAAPVYANAVVAWLPLFVVLALVEPPGTRMHHAHHGENLRAVAHALFGRGVLLPLLLAVQVTFGAATLLAVWAYQPHWESLGIGLASFGVLWALTNAVVAVTGRLAHRFDQALGTKVVVLLVAGLAAAGFAGMAHAGGAIGGVLAGLLLAASRGLNFVVLRDALNRRVPEAMRATVNSVTSLGVRLVFAAVGPAVGVAMDAQGVPDTLGNLAWGFAAAGLLLAVPLAFRIPQSGGRTAASV